MTTEIIEDAEFFYKVMVACRGVQTFNLMEDELRKIISKDTDYHMIERVEDQK